MKSLMPKEMLKDFMLLSFNKDINLLSNFSDTRLSDYIIYRQTNYGGYILYLFNGSSIYIPNKLLNLFIKLNKYSGDRILNTEFDNPFDDVDKTIYLMVDLVYHLKSDLSEINGSEVLDILGELSVIKTESFRKWFKETYEILLPPIEYKSLTDITDI